MDNINWYPGHMKKTKELIKENLKLVDMVLEVIDARIPESGRNPILDELSGTKKKVVILNKSDLADPALTQLWLNDFKSKQIDAFDIDSISGKGIKNLVEYTKGKRVMIVGIPNSGKSTLINRLKGSKSAQTGNKPGVTRGKQWIKTKDGIQLLDTPGILWPKFDDPKVGLKLAYCGSIKDEILDLPELALGLIEILIKYYSTLLAKRYDLESQLENPLETMEAIGKRRGCIISGGNIDYERTAKLVLMEFRKGTIGRITLDRIGK